jgi:tetratricopeptide (TPR) repeat protein
VTDTPVQPSLATLMARYLQQQAEAHAAGLAAVDLTGEVLPYEAGPVQPIDARPAWEEAVAAIGLLCPGVKKGSWQAPPQWPQLVATNEPATALAFSLGNFPQLVRNLFLLLQHKNLKELRPTAGRPIAAPALVEWAREVAQKKQYPQLLLAIGALRLARQFDQAADLLKAHEADVPAEWQNLLANEKAALAWHRGDAEEALRVWQAMPESVPVLFNRGMAALFLDRPADARAALSRAVAQLPDSSAWHHLGSLYLALAEMRS